METLTVKNTQQNDNNKKPTWWIIAIATILTLINVCVYQCNRAETEIKETVTTDTLWTTDTIKATDTLTFYQPVPTTEFIYQWDTLYTPKDTVPIPLKRVQYEDSVIKENGANVHYYASVSGYEPSLDTLNFDVTYPIVTNTEYVTNTIEKTIQKPAPRLTIGPSVGFGYGIFTKQPDLYAGLALTYRF